MQSLHPLPPNPTLPRSKVEHQTTIPFSEIDG
jgi:hypothetical protein